MVDDHRQDGDRLADRLPSQPALGQLGDELANMLRAEITRLARETQVVRLVEAATSGRLKYAQAERVSMFLDVERLGLGRRFYPKTTRTQNGVVAV
jgi:hypothetical protein